MIDLPHSMTFIH